MAFQVNAEKLINRSPTDVFRALREGRLFLNCGADIDTMTIDFRVGGKYQIDFKNHSLKNFGEFLEIVPNKKIVFSWCQTFGADQKPDTQVSIELFEDGANPYLKTRLVLTHTGFKTKELCDGHNAGWTDGINDMTEEIQNGRLRMVRRFETSIEKLYETCSNPNRFFAFMGELSQENVDFKVGGHYQLPTEKGKINGQFLEIIPNKKIALSWKTDGTGPIKESTLTLTFNVRDNGASALELVHEGLFTEEDQKENRQGWETAIKKIGETLR
jgi:uncharacterized protein YndB with AHSA1/START domain